VSRRRQLDVKALKGISRGFGFGYDLGGQRVETSCKKRGRKEDVYLGCRRGAARMPGEIVRVNALADRLGCLNSDGEGLGAGLVCNATPCVLTGAC